MTTLTVIRSHSAVARPVKVLVPLIQDDLRRGHAAGLEYYQRAGDKLREAYDQVPTHRWASWLTKHFGLSKRTARTYMTLSERVEDGEINPHDDLTIKEALSGSDPDRARRARRQPLDRAIREIDAAYLASEAASSTQETKKHRDLAQELINAGYKALAMRLHPDTGGSKDGMRRLNRVRRELLQIAKTRRFD